MPCSQVHATARHGRSTSPRKPRRLTSFNCSFRPRHAGLWGYYDKNKVKTVARRGALDRYVWGEKCLGLRRDALPAVA